MDKLLAKLSEQQATINKQNEALKSTSSTEDAVRYRTVEYVSATSSVPITPATDSYNFSTAPTTNPPSISGDDTPAQSAGELAVLKAELEAAKGKIARMDQELAQTRITKHTLDQVVGNASEADYPLQSEERLGHLPPLARPQFARDNSWANQDDARSDTSDALSASGFNRARQIWNNGGKPNFAAPTTAYAGVPLTVPGFQPSDGAASAQWMQRGYGQPFVESLPYGAAPAFRGDRMMQDPDMLMAPPMGRRSQPGGGRYNNRSSASSFPYASSNSSFDGFTPSSTPYGSVANLPAGVPGMGSMGMGSMYSGYQPQPIGTPLSPHAPEFTVSNAGWKGDVSPNPLLSLLPIY